MTVLDDRPAIGSTESPTEAASTVDTHTMTVLPGARELTWTADDTAAVQAARTEFDQCLSEGCMAYTSDGDTHEQIRTFDPAARNVTVSRPLQGG